MARNIVVGGEYFNRPSLEVVLVSEIGEYVSLEYKDGSVISYPSAHIEAIKKDLIPFNDVAIEGERIMEIKVKKLVENAVIPSYQSLGAAGFDLVAVEDVIIQPGESKLVRTGLAFEIPPGYEMQIRPRSGLSLKTKLRISNSPGTIDSDYRGEVCVIMDNITPIGYGLIELECEDGSIDRFTHEYDELRVHTIDGSALGMKEVCSRGVECHFPVTAGTYIIRKGERIAQGVLAEVPQARFVKVDSLGDTDRGTGGFGSTGK